MPIKWPWARERHRTAGNGYTGLYTSYLTAQVQGEAGLASETAAFETCAGLWSRAFASAAVEPVGGPVTPSWLAMAVRAMLTYGEHVSAIQGPPLSLVPASTWDITGGYDPATWRYNVQLPGPSGDRSVKVGGEGVVHLRYSVDPLRPWRGYGPLDRAGATAKVLGTLELRIGQEAGASSAYLLPIPSGLTEGADADPAAQLRADIAAAKGKTILTPTTSGGWGEGQPSAPQAEYVQKRLGFDPPAESRELREDAGLDLAAACGVPPALLLATADGTARRAAWRDFVFGSVMPVARLVEMELSAKLEMPVKLSVEHLVSSDTILTKARAAAQLVAAGSSVSDAWEAVGLE